MSNHPSRKAGRGTDSPSTLDTLSPEVVDASCSYYEHFVLGTMHETGLAALHPMQQEAFRKAVSDVLGVVAKGNVHSLTEIGLPSNPKGTDKVPGVESYYWLSRTPRHRFEPRHDKLLAACGGVMPEYCTFEYPTRFEHPGFGLLVLPSSTTERGAIITCFPSETGGIDPVKGWFDWATAVCFVLDVCDTMDEAVEAAIKAAMGYRTIRSISNEVSRLDEIAERRASTEFDDGPSF